MTRKTAFFFCCLAVLTTAPAWGGAIKGVYKCPTGEYAKGSEVTEEGKSVCKSGFSSAKPAVYVNGCTPCPEIKFAEKTQDVSTQKITISTKKPIRLRGTTNPNRYRPALQKNCYIPGGSTEYTDEAGTFTLAGNCYYTGEPN